MLIRALEIHRDQQRIDYKLLVFFFFYMYFLHLINVIAIDQRLSYRKKRGYNIKTKINSADW